MKTYKNNKNNNNNIKYDLNRNQKNFYFLLLIIFLFSCSFNLIKAKFADNLYHTNEELFEEFNTLALNCDNIMKKHELTQDGNPSNKIPYYSIEAADFNSSSKKANTVFMLFGEHSRELIPTETALFLAKSLCNKVEKYSKSTIGNILKNTKVYILPVLNIVGRKFVAEGDYCRRTNENNVDLKRNWDSHWSTSGENLDQTNPGSMPFSEWETKKLKDLLAELKPNTFITSHSGNLGMYSPFAYKKFTFNELTEASAKNMKNIQSIILKINRHNCNCISGSIGNDLGYLCPGTCLDYAFENLNIANSFAFEIYSQKQSAFYTNILDSNDLEHFDYDRFVQKNSVSSLATLIQMKMKNSLKPIKLSVLQIYF